MGTENISVKMGYIGVGDEATYNTLELMKEIVLSSQENFGIRQFVSQIISHVPAYDEMGEIATIYNFIRSRTRFTKDPLSFELLQTPDFIIRQISSGIIPTVDCDDMAVLGATFLSILGYPVHFKAISTNGDNEFSHVYVMVKVGCCYIPFDPASPIGRLGIEPHNIKKEYLEKI